MLRNIISWCAIVLLNAIYATKIGLISHFQWNAGFYFLLQMTGVMKSQVKLELRKTTGIFNVYDEMVELWSCRIVKSSNGRMVEWLT